MKIRLTGADELQQYLGFSIENHCIIIDGVVVWDMHDTIETNVNKD